MNIKNLNIPIATKNRVGVNSSLLSVLKNHLVYYPTPNNLYYV